MPTRKRCKTHPERIIGRFELQGSTVSGGISTEILFSSENANLLKSKLRRGQGVESRGEGSRMNFSLDVFIFPWKTEKFHVDIFASRSPCYSGMFVSSVKLYTVKKRHKNAWEQNVWMLQDHQTKSSSQGAKFPESTWMLRAIFCKPGKLLKWKITSYHGVIGLELQAPSRQWQSSIHISWNFTSNMENVVLPFDHTDHKPTDHRYTFDHTKY